MTQTITFWWLEICERISKRSIRICMYVPSVFDQCKKNNIQLIDHSGNIGKCIRKIKMNDHHQQLHSFSCDAFFFLIFCCCHAFRFALHFMACLLKNKCVSNWYSMRIRGNYSLSIFIFYRVCQRNAFVYIFKPRSLQTRKIPRTFQQNCIFHIRWFSHQWPNTLC